MKPQLTITLNEDGAVEVTGPISNRLLCYGMLESARDAIKDHVDQQAKSPIVPPTNGDILSISRK